MLQGGRIRILRSLALALIAVAAPFTRGAAQTCQGMSAFQDGRARIEAAGEYVRGFNDTRVTVEYGVPRSFFGGVGVDHSSAQAGPAGTSIDANLGYQIHVSDTPFQFCPMVSTRFPVDGASYTQVSLGGSLGYRIGIADGFALVPALGLWRVLTNQPDVDINLVQPLSGNRTFPPDNYRALQPNNFNDDEVSMAIGLVFNNTVTITPGLLVPSYFRAKSVFTIGASINWAHAVSR